MTKTETIYAITKIMSDPVLYWLTPWVNPGAPIIEIMSETKYFKHKHHEWEHVIHTLYDIGC
jgi:hypothetical protein